MQLWDLASSPGPLKRRRKGLIHTVCACVMFSVKLTVKLPVNSQRTRG